MTELVLRVNAVRFLSLHLEKEQLQEQHVLAVTARIDGEKLCVAHRKGNIPFWEAAGKVFLWRSFHFVNKRLEILGTDSMYFY
jgi:hypothetical protein